MLPKHTCFRVWLSGREPAPPQGPFLGPQRPQLGPPPLEEKGSEEQGGGERQETRQTARAGVGGWGPAAEVLVSDSGFEDYRR